MTKESKYSFLRLKINTEPFSLLTTKFLNLFNRNVVSSFSLKCQLDLKKIAQKARNCEFNPTKFSAVVMRIREPKTTALIFKSGKVIVTGAKTENESIIAARKFARIIQKLGNKVTFSDFSVCNIVGCLSVDHSVRLEGLAYDYDTVSSVYLIVNFVLLKLAIYLF